ncbi:hypothetical protein [Pseudonocardia charpentierae]|uniref:Uncharacterized protein n=1 Tax=Pseudonocardia charpentierae TaxID=3075545 RepID=A0ABU2NH96_9PSEU|nr:hypothetical protein [Pseudonocardia sp. DSM 45834]MDT0353328.1 hypothetical protein [Pseudonocardia sp. DSM 45834]
METMTAAAPVAGPVVQRNPLPTLAGTVDPAAVREAAEAVALWAAKAVTAVRPVGEVVAVGAPARP